MTCTLTRDTGVCRVAGRVPATCHPDPVDAQQGAAEDDVGLPADDLDRLRQGVGHCDEQAERFADVAERGGGAVAKPPVLRSDISERDQRAVGHGRS